MCGLERAFMENDQDFMQEPSLHTFTQRKHVYMHPYTHTCSYSSEVTHHVQMLHVGQRTSLS